MSSYGHSLQDPESSEGSREEDHDLARKFRDGDSEASRTVGRRVHRIVAFRGYAIPPADRRDLEQEVMAQLWQAVCRDSFDLGRSFWGFVEVVAARRCIDWVRTRKSPDPLDPAMPDRGASPLDVLLSGERRRLANRALAHLPRGCRQLIHLHAGLKKSYREIAGLLDKSEEALRVQMFRCVKQARALLAVLAESAEASSRGAER